MFQCSIKFIRKRWGEDRCVLIEKYAFIELFPTESRELYGDNKSLDDEWDRVPETYVGDEGELITTFGNIYHQAAQTAAVGDYDNLVAEVTQEEREEIKQEVLEEVVEQQEEQAQMVEDRFNQYSNLIDSQAQEIERLRREAAKQRKKDEEREAQEEANRAYFKQYIAEKGDTEEPEA